MLQTIIFCLGLAINANETSKEMHLRRQEQDRCLLAKECIAIYDPITHAFIVKPVENERDN
jgi:hypothetical protein